MSQLEKAIFNAIEDARQLDVMAQSDEVNNEAFLDGINNLVSGMERIQKESRMSAAVEIPIELIGRHIDEAQAPDVHSTEMLRRATATSDHTRGKIAAVRNLGEAVRKLSAEHGLLTDPPGGGGTSGGGNGSSGGGDGAGAPKRRKGGR